MKKKERSKKTAKKSNSKEKITKNMLIGDLVQKYPNAAYYLVAEGIHCIGCGAAAYETIGQGLKLHGKTEKQIAEILKKLNKEANSE